MAAAKSLIHLQAQLAPEQHARLAELSRVTRVPMAHYVREGIEMALDHYERETRTGKWAPP